MVYRLELPGNPAGQASRTLFATDCEGGCYLASRNRSMSLRSRSRLAGSLRSYFLRPVR
jgi:hypothetical protein